MDGQISQQPQDVDDQVEFGEVIYHEKNPQKNQLKLKEIQTSDYRM